MGLYMGCVGSLVLVGLVVLMVVFVVSEEVGGKSVMVGYESGFESGGGLVGSLAIRYYMMVVVFLLLDMEVGVFAILPVKVFYMGVGVLLVVFFSGWVYLFGTIYEWSVGSLSWGY